MATETTDWITTLDQEVAALVIRLDADPAARRLYDGTTTATEYIAFLEQIYHYVRWTRPLCAYAGARLAATCIGGPGEARGADGRAVLAALLLRKAEEESGHEQWALDDLAALGRDPEVVMRAEPAPATQAYIAWSRYTAEAGAPEAFLGTAYVLEALSAHRAGDAAARLVARAGILGIEGAVRFLRGHADADEGHVRELAELLATIPGPEAREAILLSARVTRTVYPDMIAGALAGAALLTAASPIMAVAKRAAPGRLSTAAPHKP
ncbi:iron-containing redox enzyme family protein [Sorangium atrum]|uniref:Iron-containing redox enzyme family protein n=1 Tax=Sorangium atrum TaxID=2995308 RepID=A0ABT5CK79_9BACT|nr:iron-containing redox enzyme family protein [Sorangium aterium]MDC0685491.1 iron-containing redox enzyme family protein [Sorangium aterium]